MNNVKPFNLEERTLLFALDIIEFCKEIQRDIINRELINQLVRSSASVGANYREATEASSKRDFRHRMRIARKECKETTFWLEILMKSNQPSNHQLHLLIKESRELRNIFSAIIDKSNSDL